MIKKIGILTSGGDAPGMNSALIGAIRSGINANKEMYVIYDGYKGLIEGKIQKVNKDTFKDKMNQGGTVIKTARLPEFKELSVRQKAVEILRKEGIDALIVIGGDGSYMGAKKLTELGINCIGLPGTIDNDIASTDYTIGFDTALNTVVNEIDNIVDTSSSHHRCAVVEIMGNRCADLTLYAGIATNADIILTKDHPFTTDEVIETLNRKKKEDQDYALVLVSEKFMDTNGLVEEIKKRTTWDTRLTVLGHTQRGGKPSAMERVNAVYMADYAIKLLNEGKGGMCVGIRNSKPVAYPIEEALKLENNLHKELYKLHDDVK